MAIALFPNNPSDGDTTLAAGVTYTYNGTLGVWKATPSSSSGGSSVTISDTSPSSPVSGDIWFDSTRLNSYVYYDDGTTQAWISSTNLSGMTSNGSLVSIGTTQPTNSSSGDIWFDTSTSKMYIYYDDGTTQNWVVTNAGISLVWSTEKNTNFTAIAGNSYPVNTTNNAVTVTLPANPTSSNTVQIVDTGGNAETNNITITSVSDNIMGTTDPFVLDSNWTSVTLVYNSVTSGWVVSGTTTSKTISSLSNVNILGISTVGTVSEIILPVTGATGTVAHDITSTNTFYHTSISSDFTVNITNVPTTNDRICVVALLLSQGATAYMPIAVEIDGVAQTITWPNATPPTGNANLIDVVSFSLLRNSDTWTILGSSTTFG